MQTERMKWLLKNKIVTDFRGFPIGRVKKIYYDDSKGPLVIVERNPSDATKTTWEAIPIRAIDSVRDHVRLKPPTFAE